MQPQGLHVVSFREMSPSQLPNTSTDQFEIEPQANNLHTGQISAGKIHAYARNQATSSNEEDPMVWVQNPPLKERH